VVFRRQAPLLGRFIADSGTLPSNRMQPRGDALPLPLDSARKPIFLHGDSVATLTDLLDPGQRDADGPHPFFADDAEE